MGAAGWSPAVAAGIVLAGLGTGPLAARWAAGWCRGVVASGDTGGAGDVSLRTGDAGGTGDVSLPVGDGGGAASLLWGAGLAAGWLLAYSRFRLGGAFLPVAVLWFFLLIVAVVDIHTHRIPDRLLAWAASATVPLAWGTGVTPWAEGLAGAAACGGFLLAVALAGKGSLGGGDVKLGALLGSLLGWRLGAVALALGFAAGAAAGLALLLLKLKGRDDFMAFGPYLALGAAMALFWGW